MASDRGTLGRRDERVRQDRGMTFTEENYVEQAEQVIRSLREPNRRPGELVINLTTSKIRGMLSMVSELYTEAQHTPGNELSGELAGRVQYLKMRIAYEAGREPQVKKFEEKAQLMHNLTFVKKDKEKLLLFCRYMEALVAYHRYYGGKE